MMKKLSLLLFSVVVFLSGCGLLGEAQNTINYVTEATEYINELSNYAEEAKNLMNEGNINIEQLEFKFTDIEKIVTDFNSIEVPEIAEGIHESITANNDKLLDAINKVMNGEISIEEIMNSNIFQTIDSITNFMNQLEQLGLE